MSDSSLGTQPQGEWVSVVLRERRVLPSGVVEWDDVPVSAFVPAPLPPRLDWPRVKVELFEAFQAAHQALARLDGLERGVPDSNVLLRALVFREAKLSSQIENIWTTAEDMAIAAAGRRVDPDSPGNEAANYVRALEHGMASPLPFCRRLICEMHAILLRDVRGGDKQPGKLRDIGVYIGNPALGPRRARFIPPPPGAVLETALDQLDRFMNEQTPDIPALAKNALMHYQFECIHPFRDGNGRIGRALISRELCTTGILRRPLVYASAYIEANRVRYADLLLRVSTEGAWIEWIAFLLEAFRTQAIDACLTCERLISLHRAYAAKLHQARARPRVFRLVDRLFSIPIVSAKEASEVLGVSNPTARADIQLLVDLDILQEVTGRAWGRDWGAKDILAAIDAAGPAETSDSAFTP